MRTDKEKMDFAKACLMIEKKGGNVQKYIALNWPSYTPRATWYNIQRVYLGRSTNELTEGKPRINSDGKEVKIVKTRRDRNKALDEVLKIIEDHGDPVAWFMNEGYEAPIQAWRALRDWARTNRPEDAEKLPQDLRKYYAENSVKRPGKADDAPKPSENPPEEVKAPETVTLGGKTYELFVRDENPDGTVTDRKITTCCAPAKPSGPIKWDDNGDMNGAPHEIAMEKLSIKEEPIKKLKLRTLQGEMGTYEKLADDRMLFTGSPRPFTDCGYTVSEWLVLIEELQIAMQQLGLSK